MTNTVANATPIQQLLAAVERVIAAGQLDWDAGADVDTEQGRAHADLVEAYKALRADAPDEPTLQHRFAAELHRLASDVVRLNLPLAASMSASLGLGVLDNRADLERWADYLDSTVEVNRSNNIPHIRHEIRLGEHAYGPDLTVRAQIQPDELSEVERLRAENAQLRAQVGGAA